MVKHAGGCHCGRVRFEVLAPARIRVSECNCSICSKSGYLHLVVPADRNPVFRRDIPCYWRLNGPAGIERAFHSPPTLVQHVCVDHRGADVLVAQQLLDGA
jgi:hypothetical protein